MEPEVRPVRKRRRPMSSCEQCRRRKVKCDQKSPCDQCIRSKCDSCVYYRFHPSLPQDDNSPAKDATRYPQVEDNLLTNGWKVPQSPSSSSPANSSRPVPASAKPRDTANHESRSVRELRDKIDSLEKELSIARTADVNPERQFYSDVTELKGVVSKTRLMGRSHFMYIIKQGYVNVVELYRTLAFENPDDNILAGIERCKKLGKSIKERNKWHQALSSDLKSYVPAKELSDMLVQTYFRTFESVHRIVHIPSFNDEYDKFWTQPEKASVPFLIKLLLILAIGTAFQYGRDNFNELRESAKVWVHVAHSWVNFPFTEKHVVSVTGVQIHCLLLLAREVTEIGTDMTWLAAGGLLRIAFLIGLHRDPSKYPGMSEFQSEVRRRLWATVNEICFQSSMACGGLPMVDLDNSDCLPPRNLNDDQIGEGLNGVPVERGQGELTQSSIQRMLAQTLPLRIRIAAALNDTKQELSYSETNKLGTELSQVYQAQLKQLMSMAGKSKPTAFQLRIMKLLNVGTLGSLHMPFAIQARKDPSYFFSRKTCLDVALAVLAPDDHGLEGDAHEAQALSDSRCLEIVGGGYFRSMSTIAALMVYGELSNPDGDMIMFMSAAESVVRREMRRAIEHFGNLTLERLKAGERNIKGHLFFGAIEAQLDAHEKGLAFDGEVRRALKESLERCTAVLEARANMTQTPGSETTTLGSEMMAFDAFASDLLPEQYWWDDLDFDYQDVNFSRAWNML